MPDAGRSQRPSRLRAAALAVIACAALAAGCGEDDSGSTSGGADAATELTITLDRDGNDGPEPPLGAQVRCPGDGPAVCDSVDALPEDPGAPTDPQTACTEIYGGPDELTVTGSLRGEPIDAAFTRENGCEIERFERFSELLTALFPDYRTGSAIGA